MSESKYYKNRNADDKQGEVYKKFPVDSFLGSAQNTDHFMQWVTFFRRNLHRFALDYLGLKLHWYQILLLYLMGISINIVVIASRAAAKSFMIALYACCRCILYPGSMVVLSASTKGQSKILVTEKIENELMGKMSPVLRKEISKIKDNQNEIIVYFKNHSTIRVVPASENARGTRSNVVIREEFRQIKKSVDDSVLSPFQIIRQTPYLKDEFYANISELKEESVNVYISSSWMDNGHWMWGIVDQAYDEMMSGKDSCLLAFDESVALKHGIKSQRYFQGERKKQDPLTWRIEFLNERVRENEHAFFSYSMLNQNQKSKRAFYPRVLADFKSGRKNPFDIPKQAGEVRIVSCDMAFVENKNNDNSIYTCMRLLPECTTYKRESSDDLKIDNGYRRIVPYLESIQGGDLTKQAIRIRQLYEDFGADYIVLDVRNAGIAIYDLLANVMYDEERGIEYSPLSCMNDENMANRIKIGGAKQCIFVISASQSLNSTIAINFRTILDSKKIDLLVTYEQAFEEILPNIKEYSTTPDASIQSFYEAPFLETQALVSETAGLLYEKKEQTGVIVVKEPSGSRKDRYTSVSYGSYFAGLLEQDTIQQRSEYEYGTYIN